MWLMSRVSISLLNGSMEVPGVAINLCLLPLCLCQPLRQDPQLGKARQGKAAAKQEEPRKIYYSGGFTYIKFIHNKDDSFFFT